MFLIFIYLGVMSVIRIYPVVISVILIYTCVISVIPIHSIYIILILVYFIHLTVTPASASACLHAQTSVHATSELTKDLKTCYTAQHKHRPVYSRLDFDPQVLMKVRVKIMSVFGTQPGHRRV